jgi:hypothetical protein
LKGGLLKEGSDFIWIVLQAAHGRNDLAFEVGLSGRYRATHGVGFEMLPHQFIRIAIRGVRRKMCVAEISKEVLFMG